MGKHTIVRIIQDVRISEGQIIRDILYIGKAAEKIKQISTLQLMQKALQINLVYILVVTIHFKNKQSIVLP